MCKAAISALLFLMSTSTYVWAEEKIKAGLWEMSMKTDAMPSMPKLSPGQLEQMRKMGIQAPQMQGGAMVSKVCITKEMAEREQAPGAEKESGCQSKNYQRSGASYSADIFCDGPSLKGEGKVKGVFSGQESFSSTYEFKGTAQGQAVKQRHDSSGKWISADCGDVKPMGEMARRK